MKVGAGAFGGISINSTNVSFKFYIKTVAKVNVFGIPLNVLDIEASSNTVGKSLIYKLYIKQGSSVDKIENRKIELALNLIKDTINIVRSRDIFYRSWSIYVYITEINVYIKGTLSSGMNIGTCASISLIPPTAKTTVDTKLSLNLRVTGETYVSLLVNSKYVTGFVKNIPNRTFSISRNTVLKYCSNCVSLVLHYSRTRLAV